MHQVHGKRIISYLNTVDTWVPYGWFLCEIKFSLYFHPFPKILKRGVFLVLWMHRMAEHTTGLSGQISGYRKGRISGQICSYQYLFTSEGRDFLLLKNAHVQLLKIVSYEEQHMSYRVPGNERSNDNDMFFSKHSLL